jgi:hypothetical protein
MGHYRFIFLKSNTDHRPPITDHRPPITEILPCQQKTARPMLTSLAVLALLMSLFESGNPKPHQTGRLVSSSGGLISYSIHYGKIVTNSMRDVNCILICAGLYAMLGYDAVRQKR